MARPGQEYYDAAAKLEKDGLTGFFGSKAFATHQLIVSGNKNIQLTNSVSSGMGGSAGVDDEEKKKKDERFADEMRRIQEYMNALSARKAELGVMMDQLRADIREHKKELVEINLDLETIEEIKSACRNGEEIPLDVDGSLKNKRAERILKEYEKRTGKTVDRNNPASINHAVEVQEAEKILPRQQQIETEIKKKSETLITHEREETEITQEAERVQKKIEKASSEGNAVALDSVLAEASEAAKESLLTSASTPIEIKEKLQKEMKIEDAKEADEIAFSFGDPKQVFAKAVNGQTENQPQQDFEIKKEKTATPGMSG